tara:strand:+ start:3725 stop:4177 length:453 start_codon:yes stop_codon:yes gene_type:complete
MYFLTGTCILFCTGYLFRNKFKHIISEKKRKIIFVTIKLVTWALYLKLWQKCNKSLRKIDKNNYELTYMVENRIFKYKFNLPLGPSPVLMVINEHEEDITKEIKEIMGPMYNWHGIAAVTPDLLGYKSLTFELSNGEQKNYNDHEVIPNF